MNNFSLSCKKEKNFPTSVKSSCGEIFCINADFRNILKIMRLQDDANVLEKQRIFLTLRWFYTEKQPASQFEGLQLLYEFIGNGQEPTDRHSEPQFCYEFDSTEIYASFLQDYQIDLCEIEFLHWRKFMMMLTNLSNESPFSQKIRLRFLDLREYKGEAYLRISKAKRLVQLPVRYTADELKLLSEMKARLR